MKVELEVLAGLEPYACQEVKRLPGVRVERTGAGRVSLNFKGDVGRLRSIRSAVAAYLVLSFAFKRPKALLGHQAFNELVDACREVMARYPGGAFETFRVSAAGADSQVFRRIRQDLGSTLGLTEVSERPNLLVAVRPGQHGVGWEALVRLSPKPLSARSWRVCNYTAALDATIAHVMATLCGVYKNQRFLNLACGSGTLLAERLLMGPAAEAVGIDESAEVLECARQNIEAAGLTDRCRIIHADATSSGLDESSFDGIAADLPFGMSSGPDGDLAPLYRGVIREAGRLAAPSAKMSVITTRRSLFLETLDENAGEWRLLESFQVSIPAGRGYIQPEVFLLQRRA